MHGPHFLPMRLLAGLALAGTLASCGQPPTAYDVPGRAAAPLVAPAVPATGPSRAEADLLAKVAAAMNAVNFMEGDVAFRESKDGREEHGAAHFSFRRAPFAARVDIAGSNRWLATGATVLWHGGDSVRIRRKGIPLTVSFPANHALVVSLRGYRLDQTDIFSMAHVLLAAGADVRLAGRARIEGGDRLLLDVRSPASVPGVTRERIGLDPATFIPTYREMYARGALVHRGVGKHLVLNRPLEQDRFKL